jgi:glycosyltransferase involved in cell wall biosynthesis
VRTALVHEWFTALAGSESVVEQLCHLYPDADLYAVYADAGVVAATDYLCDRRLQTSFIKHLPRAAQSFRSYLLLMPLAVEQFDLSPYDLVISSSHAVAKGVLTGPNQLHISYVHSPIRYAWDLQHQYLREAHLDTGMKGWVAKWMLHRMRIWDYRTAAGVDHFVANSRYVARRISKVYGRHADVIYPPVDVARFGLQEDKGDFYLAASRLVPYKRMDLIVEAFAAMPDKRLVVIGDGPEADKVKAKAGRNVELMGYQPDDVLRETMQQARAFVFAAEEDFGIIPVEAQACGTPVIAFGKGGALETVRGPEREHPTGLFFYRQDAASIVDAVQQFEADYERFEPKACRANAERFSARRFAAEFEAYAEKCWNTFESKAPDERALANSGDSLVPDYPEYVPLRSGIPGVDDQGDPFIEHERFHASG